MWINDIKIATPSCHEVEVVLYQGELNKQYFYISSSIPSPLVYLQKIVAFGFNNKVHNENTKQVFLSADSSGKFGVA